MLVVDGGFDGELLKDNEDAAADRDEDLAHDEIADGLVGAAEVDHETLSEDIERNGNVQEPLEFAGSAD